MKRRVAAGDRPPEILTRFVAAEWPAGKGRAALREWRAARHAFFEVHGWPGGFVALLQEQLAEEKGVWDALLEADQ